MLKILLRLDQPRRVPLLIMAIRLSVWLDSGQRSSLYLLPAIEDTCCRNGKQTGNGFRNVRLISPSSSATQVRVTTTECRNEASHGHDREVELDHRSCSDTFAKDAHRNSYTDWLVAVRSRCIGSDDDLVVVAAVFHRRQTQRTAVMLRLQTYNRLERLTFGPSAGKQATDVQCALHTLSLSVFLVDVALLK